MSGNRERYVWCSSPETELNARLVNDDKNIVSSIKAYDSAYANTLCVCVCVCKIAYVLCSTVTYYNNYILTKT